MQCTSEDFEGSLTAYVVQQLALVLLKVEWVDFDRRIRRYESMYEGKG